MKQLHATSLFQSIAQYLCCRDCDVELSLGNNIFSYVKTQTALDEIIETHSSAFLGSVKLSKYKKSLSERERGRRLVNSPEQESVDWRCEVVAECRESGFQLLPVDTAGLVPGRESGLVWPLAGIFVTNQFLLVKRLEAVLPVNDISPQGPELVV